MKDRNNLLRNIMTWIIVSVFLLGMLITLGVGSSLVVRIKKGEDNAVTSFFLQNASANLAELKPTGSAAKYFAYDSVYEKYIWFVDTVEDLIDNIATTSFPHNSDITAAVTFLKEDVLQDRIADIENEASEHKLTSSLTETAEKLAAFQSRLSDIGVDFVYLETPEMGRVTSVKAGDSTFADCADARHADAFVQKLSDLGVKICDILSDEEYVSSIQYDLTLHWFASDAYTATQKLAEYLNSELLYEFDLEAYQNDYYDIFETTGTGDIIYQNFHMDYSVMAPLDAGSYEFYRSELLEETGDFTEVLLTPSEKWDIEEGAEVYFNVYRVSNGSLIDIKNLDASQNADKHIMIIGESFDWLIVTYLATQCGHITFVTPGYMDSFGVEKYISINQPDLVIMAYNDCHFDEEGLAAVFHFLDQ